MQGVTQVAFQLDQQRLVEIDLMVERHEFRSRAEALRAAVGEFVARRREERIDAELTAGYAARPSGEEERSWAELSVEGLRTADLEW